MDLSIKNNNKNVEIIAKELKDLYLQLKNDAPNLPLAKSGLDIVPGEGSAGAEIIFIGEAPGLYESIQRRPFVGRSGQLFRKILLEDSGINPESVFISNIVKVRPPDNRDPNIEELEAYKKYLDQEISILNPKLIVTLGRFSMGKFFSKNTISQIHGKLYKVNWSGRTDYVLPMYHPAAALRSTRTKLAFIDDFKIPKIIDWINKQKDINQKNSKKTDKRMTKLQKEFAKSDRSIDKLQVSIIDNLF